MASSACCLQFFTHEINESNAEDAIDGSKSPNTMILLSKDGYAVKLEQLEVELSLLGYLEGDPLYIREKILNEDIPRRFKNETRGLIVRVPPPAPLPEYAIFLHLMSNQLVSQELYMDYSVLVMVWFQDELPVDLPLAIQEQIGEILWKAHAKDVMC